MAYYIILDAGHAYNTSGKRNTIVSPTWYEYAFNNDMQNRLKPRLEAHGITVYLDNPNPSTVKDIALTTRATLANNKYIAWGRPSNCIFISIHANAAGSGTSWSTARGVEVYYASNASTNSKNLALILTNQIYNDVHAIDNGFKNRGRKCADFTVIYKTIMPCVLVENAFYDNQADLNLMNNHRDVFVEAIVKGVCTHFGITYKAPTASTPSTSTGSFLVKVIYTGSEGLNIRKDASLTSAVVGQVYCGEVFTIVETKGTWGRLKSGLGYISLNEKYVQKL